MGCGRREVSGSVALPFPALFDLGAALRFGAVLSFSLFDLAANLRVGGLRRDGYGVRRKCFALATESPALGEPATLRKTTRLRSTPAQTRFAS